MIQIFLKLGGLIGLLLLLLSGCATRPSQTTAELSASSPNAMVRLNEVRNLTSFYASGKVSFSDGKKGGTASLEWQQLNNNYSIVLIGALGSGTLAIQGNGGRVTLVTSEGQSYTANTAEQLIQQHLGWVMPISSLQYWLKGIYAAGQAPTRTEWDHNNRLVVLEQQGWKIEYLAYTNVSGIDMPSKLQLERGPIRLRFLFKQWRF